MADTDEAETDVEHAVIAHYRLADDGLGEPSQWEIVRQAQSLLTEAIEQADVGEFDGNEYGGGEVVLYAYGPDAEALFAVMAPILNDLQFRPAHVVCATAPSMTHQLPSIASTSTRRCTSLQPDGHLGNHVNLPLGNYANVHKDNTKFVSVRFADVDAGLP
ncbi:hypothetical protein ACFVTT_25580 [Streptomyces niveus]|uniref:hypothetical protein n=1 Tax=Streptomyces niveus TaxID=193462 RepID=UPI0034447C28